MHSKGTVGVAQNIIIFVLLFDQEEKYIKHETIFMLLMRFLQEKFEELDYNCFLIIKRKVTKERLLRSKSLLIS